MSAAYSPLERAARLLYSISNFSAYAALHCRLLLNIDMQLRWVYELDSSTASKFSRHLLVKVPGAAFTDSSHVGAFIGQIMSWPEVDFGFS